MSVDITSENSIPSRRSTTVLTVLSLLAATLFFREVVTLTSLILAGLGGIACLAVSLHLLEGQPNPGSRLATSLLTIPIAIGFTVGIVGTGLVLVGTYFPVSTGAEISTAVLLISGNIGVVIGGTLAVFGVILGGYTIVSTTALGEFTKTTLVTAIVPLTVGFGLVTNVTLFERGSGAEESLFGEFAHAITAALFSPTGPDLHLASFFTTLTIAAGALWLLLSRLPVTDLTTRSPALSEDAVTRWLGVLPAVTIVAALGAAVGFSAETVLSPTELRSILGPTLYTGIQAVTTATPLRVALFGIALLAIGLATVTVLLRTVSGKTALSRLEWTGPIAGGLFITITAAALADRIFAAVVDETASRLPEMVATDFLDLSGTIAQIYGETIVAVLLAGILVGLTAWIGLLFWVGVYLEYLSKEGMGYSIAGFGLIVAAVSANTIGASRWLVIGGVASSMVVFMLGGFSTTVGRELGRSGSPTLEYVRIAAVFIVGLAAVLVAVTLESTLSGVNFELAPRTTVALLSFTVGLLSFVIALR